MSIAGTLKPLISKKIQDRGYSSIRSFAKINNLNHSTIIKSMNGNSIPRREIVERWCNALECTPKERKEIFHAAGYLLPDELDEEESAAA